MSVITPDEGTAETAPMKAKSGAEGGFVPQYDVASDQRFCGAKERYVDATSQKTEFDKVVDELRSISADTLSWDILRATRKHFGDTAENEARKLEAFMGAYIVNAASQLYDQGLEEEAFRQLDRARSVLEAKRKLSLEMASIRARTQTEDDAFDVSDLLGLTGGGGH